MNVLAVGAHPDDCEYGCFGTLAKHVKAGDHVYLLHVAYGVHGVDPAERVEESSRSARLLGALANDFCDFTIFDVDVVKPSLIDAVAEVIARVEPRRVYTNSSFDTHQNHWVTSKAVRVAARYVPEVMLFETPSTTREFAPSMYVDISDEIDLKVACLGCYESQLSKRPYLREVPVRSLASFRYTQSRLSDLTFEAGYAEAFMVERLIC